MLMDYQSAEGDLDLRKDERLRVFKRYNHWSYCVQERDGHARGWVPSWYIGKLSPSTSASATSASGGRDALSKVGSNNALSPSATGNGSNMDLRAAQLNADGGRVAVVRPFGWFGSGSCQRSRTCHRLVVVFLTSYLTCISLAFLKDCD